MTRKWARARILPTMICSKSPLLILSKSNRDLSEAIRLDPDYAESYAERGTASYEAGDYPTALADYETYIRLNGINKQRAQDFLPTIREKVKPERTAEEWYTQGRKQIEAENYDEAIRCFDEAIRLSSAFGYAYYGRGFSLHRKGEFENALKDFDQAIRLQPSFAESYAERGAIYFETGNYQDALNDYEAYLRLNGQNQKGAQDFIRTIQKKLNEK